MSVSWNASQELITWRSEVTVIVRDTFPLRRLIYNSIKHTHNTHFTHITILVTRITVLYDRVWYKFNIRPSLSVELHLTSSLAKKLVTIL